MISRQLSIVLAVTLIPIWVVAVYVMFVLQQDCLDALGKTRAGDVETLQYYTAACERASWRFEFGLLAGIAVILTVWVLTRRGRWPFVDLDAMARSDDDT